MLDLGEVPEEHSVHMLVGSNRMNASIQAFALVA